MRRANVPPAASDVVPIPLEPTLHAPRMEVDMTRSDFAARPLFALLLERTNLLIVRSEEHTSELQSH